MIKHIAKQVGLLFLLLSLAGQAAFAWAMPCAMSNPASSKSDSSTSVLIEATKLPPCHQQMQKASTELVSSDALGNGSIGNDQSSNSLDDCCDLECNCPLMGSISGTISSHNGAYDAFIDHGLVASMTLETPLAAHQNTLYRPPISV